MVEKSLVWRCGFLQARFQPPEAALPKSSICLGNLTNQKLESLLRTWRGYPWQITTIFPCAAYNKGLTLRSGFWVPKQGDVVRYKPIWWQYETHMLNFGTTGFGIVVTHEMVAVGGAMRGRDADWVSATAVLLVDTYSKQSQTLIEKVPTSFVNSVLVVTKIFVGDMIREEIDGRECGHLQRDVLFTVMLKKYLISTLITLTTHR